MSRLFSRRTLSRGLAMMTVAAVLGGLAWYFGRHLTLRELVAHELAWREQIADSPWRSIPIGMAVYAGASLVPGTGGKSVVAGWLFGAIAGLAVVMTGLVSAALISFLAGRYLLRDPVEARLPGTVLMLNQALERDGPFYLLALRMAHAPFTLINYASSASRLPLSTFVWTTFVGLLPTSALLAWFGSTLPTLRELARHGVLPALDAPLVAAFVLIALLPVLTRLALRLGMRLAQRFRNVPINPTDSSQCPS